MNIQTTHRSLLAGSGALALGFSLTGDLLAQQAAGPDLPGDPRHAIAEPTFDEIAAQLRVHGLPGEVELWRRVLGE